MNGRIAQLSLAALRAAAVGRWTETAVVAQWLYRFGSVPHLPAMDRDFGPDDDPIAVLGMSSGGATRRVLEACFEASSLSGWYSFAHRPVRTQTVPVAKVYVSPRPEALPEAFPRIADLLVQFEVRSFKVGRGIEGLLRPDKIVVYFEDGGQMHEFAEALGRSLDGCPVQGVPFTSELHGDGLLSTGVDPPASDPPVSWRSWVTARLGASLSANRGMAREDLVATVLADIRLAGVDPDLWQPIGDPFGRMSPL